MNPPVLFPAGRLCLLRLAASGLFCAGVVSAFAAPNKLRTYFSFEKEIWQETTGSKLVLKTPVRHPGNPVIARGEGKALDSHRLSFTSLIPEDGKLRAWYTAMGDAANYKEHIVAYAESEDGVHWVKPKFDRVVPGTNAVLKGCIVFVVVPDETTAEKSYRALAGFFRDDVGTPAAQGHPGATFKLVSSKNGLDWEFDHEPAISVRHFETYGLFRRNQEWWVLGQGVSPYFHLPDGTPHSRVMYGFHSRDGIAWDLYPRPLFKYPVNPHFPDSSLQNHEGAAVWDRGRVLIGLMGQFWPGGFSATVHMTVGLTYSYDGIEWAEPFSQTPWLSVGSKGTWDAGCLLPVQRPISRGDLTHVYYSGFDGGNAWTSKSAIGLVTLRRDGFAALTAEHEKARLVTKPVSLAAQETTLYLNSRGRVTVQVLDEHLKPLSSPKMIDADGVRISALEMKSLNLANPFRLVFTLEEGTELYTFSFGPPPDSLSSIENWE